MQSICLCYWKQTLLGALCFEAGISGLTIKSVGFGSCWFRVHQLCELVAENQYTWMTPHGMQ